jgi:hypothetical protein
MTHPDITPPSASGLVSYTRAALLQWTMREGQLHFYALDDDRQRLTIPIDTFLRAAKQIIAAITPPTPQHRMPDDWFEQHPDATNNTRRDQYDDSGRA